MKKPRWKPEGLSIVSHWVGNGIQAHTCNAVNSPSPVGTIWTCLWTDAYDRTICEIVSVYVPAAFRRLGIARYLMQTMLKTYGTLRTGYGSRQGGNSLLKSMGWKQNKQTGDWYLRSA